MKNIIDIINEAIVKKKRTTEYVSDLPFYYDDIKNFADTSIKYKYTNIGIIQYDDMPKYMVSLKEEWNKLPNNTKLECINTCKQIIDTFDSKYNGRINNILFLGYRTQIGSTFKLDYINKNNKEITIYFAIDVKNSTTKLKLSFGPANYEYMSSIDEFIDNIL